MIRVWLTLCIICCHFVVFRQNYIRVCCVRVQSQIAGIYSQDRGKGFIRRVVLLHELGFLISDCLCKIFRQIRDSWESREGMQTNLCRLCGIWLSLYIHSFWQKLGQTEWAGLSIPFYKVLRTMATDNSNFQIADKCQSLLVPHVCISGHVVYHHKVVPCLFSLKYCHSFFFFCFLHNLSTTFKQSVYCSILYF